MKYSLPYILAAFAFLPFLAFAQSSTIQSPNGTMCYDLYKPVCATHQVECFAAPCYPVYETYSNSCFAGAANATVIHEGACTAAEQGMASTTPTPKPAPKPYVPPKGCIAYFDGCNHCSVRPNGGTICTMMACYPDTKPGYCTAYAAGTPTAGMGHHATSTTPKPVISTTTEATSTAPASQTPPTHLGFFAQLFAHLQEWFSHLF